MLTALRQSDQTKVTARESEKADGPFSCQGCASELILNKGRIRVHHFKHKPPVTCLRGRGETALHLQAKQEIFDALRRESNVSELEIEKSLDGSVADVYARISGIPVAIEIQRSTLSVNDIVARTRNYQRLGIAVLWAGLPTASLAGAKYNPRAWELWCHAAYFGRVYYWESGQVFRVVHFGSHKTYVEERTWYESGGYEQSAGGYERTSKRYRTPRSGMPVLLSRSFRPTLKPAWSGGTVHVPECRLYLDIQPAWWK